MHTDCSIDLDKQVVMQEVLGGDVSRPMPKLAQIQVLPYATKGARDAHKTLSFCSIDFRWKWHSIA